jgi:tripartite-type tricarboxylate transporter receptor subunit TctC
VLEYSRRRLLCLTASAIALAVASRFAWAQAYPTRPVRLIAGAAPGGAPDIYGRLVAHWLSERLGQPFIVENRPGSGTNIATETVVRAAPDGHTLLITTLANAVNATLYPNLHYNFIHDIAPVASISREPLAMEVVPSFPATTVPEFIAYAKTNPGKLSVGSAGNGTSPHMASELFKLMTGIDMVHVPYRSSAAALTDLLGGQVQVLFGPLPSTIETVRAGKLRALAVTTASRSDALPEVPPMGRGNREVGQDREIREPKTRMNTSSGRRESNRDCTDLYLN